MFTQLLYFFSGTRYVLNYWSVAFIFLLIYLFLASVHKNLKYFETIHADKLKHKIVKRGLKESSHPFNKIKEVEFSALGQNFKLVLSPKREVIHSKFKAYSVDADGKETTIHLDHDNFYGGRVFGEVESDVSMHIEDGVLTGSIHLPDETYHIEVNIH